MVLLAFAEHPWVWMCELRDVKTFHHFQYPGGPKFYSIDSWSLDILSKGDAF